MRQLALEAGSPLADSPVLKPNPKEPEDPFVNNLKAPSLSTVTLPNSEVKIL